MIIFILVHKNLRRALDIVKIAIQIEDVKKIYLILSDQTQINDKELLNIKDQYQNKILFYKHSHKGIKGAWLQSLKIAVEEKTDFIIFENDIVPSIFFFKFAKLCFSFYRNERKFFGFTGYCPKKNYSIIDKFNLDTIFSYRFSSWSFATYPDIAKKFLLFLEKNPLDELGNILWRNRSLIGKDIYGHFLSDQKNNRELFGYIWAAFMISEKGLWLYPSENLVSCYINDEYATNCSDDSKNIISNYDLDVSKNQKIKLRPISEFSMRKNKKIIEHFYPNIFQRVFRKFIK